MIKKIHEDLIKALKMSDTEVISHLLKLIDIDEIVDFTQLSANNLCSKLTNVSKFEKIILSSTFLWYACNTSSDFKIIKLFVNAGANLNLTSESLQNSTPLMVACSKSNFNVVKFLIQTKRANIQLLDSNGENCLFYAASFVHFRDFFCHKRVVYRNLNDVKIDALEAMGSALGDMYYSSKIEDKIEIGLTFWFLSLVQREELGVEKEIIYSNDGFQKEFQTKEDLELIRGDIFEATMQGLYIKHKICNKYKFARDILNFSLFKQLRCYTFWNPREFPVIKEQLIQIYIKTLELQVFYLAPLEENTIAHIFEILDYFYFFKLLEQRPERYIEFSMNNENLVNQFERFSEKISVYCLTILKICLCELFRVYEYLKASVKQNNFSILLISQLENNFILPLKNIANQLSFFDSNFQKYNYHLESELVSKFADLDYTGYTDIKCRINDISRLIFFNLKLCFKNKDLTLDYKNIMRALIFANNKNANYSDSFLFLSLGLDSFQRYFNYSKTNDFNNFTHVDLEYTINLKTRVANRFELSEFLLNLGANANILTSHDNCNNSFLNFSLFENYFYHRLPKNYVEQFIHLFIKHGAHVDFLNDNKDTFETLYCKYNNRVDFNKLIPNNCIPLKCLAARVINKNFFDLKKIPVDLLTFIERH